MLTFDSTICKDFLQAIQREWLVTNSIGGYASSTIIGCNTRRYHGLLVVATQPPTGRMVLLSRLEESLLINGQRYDLGCNEYPGAIHPQGFQYLNRFELGGLSALRYDPSTQVLEREQCYHPAFDSLPNFHYQVGDVLLVKSVFMRSGENTTVVLYQVVAAPEGCEVEIRPFIACRDYHHLQRENPYFHTGFDERSVRLSFTPYESCPTLHLHADLGAFVSEGYWYRSCEYAIEKERGLDFQEDLYSPGLWRARVQSGDRCFVVATTEGINVSPHTVDDWLNQRQVDGPQEGRDDRRSPALRKVSANTLAQVLSKSDFLLSLVKAADSFIVKRGSDQLHTIIAGYHWFTDWGRDTMIALPGLTLVTGRFEIAASILANFARYCDQGMIPNRFPDAGETPDFNTVDATLWFFHAVYKFLQYTRDVRFVEERLIDAMTEMIDWHLRGTRYNIHCDPGDGLLAAGVPGSQLTWMDAKVDDWVVTPRVGKPVEVNALWYNALKAFLDVSTRLNRTMLVDRCQEVTALVEANFAAKFWNEEEGCLFDVLTDEGPDASIRPNQILAVSLPFPLLSADRATKIVQKVESELLTPRGLRSLSPRAPAYRGIYVGDQVQRDGAYHQGTVWAWLVGPFCRALVQLQRGSDSARARVLEILKPFEAHLTEAGLGTISEIFDGDPPHAPRGCMAQAWSIAEVLRAYVEDGLGIEPEND